MASHIDPFSGFPPPSCCAWYRSGRARGVSCVSCVPSPHLSPARHIQRQQRIIFCPLGFPGAPLLRAAANHAAPLCLCFPFWHTRPVNLNLPAFVLPPSTLHRDIHIHRIRHKSTWAPLIPLTIVSTRLRLWNNSSRTPGPLRPAQRRVHSLCSGPRFAHLTCT